MTRVMNPYRKDAYYQMRWQVIAYIAIALVLLATAVWQASVAGITTAMLTVITLTLMAGIIIGAMVSEWMNVSSWVYEDWEG